MHARTRSHLLLLGLMLLLGLTCSTIHRSAAEERSAYPAESYATVIMYHRFGDHRFPETNTTIEQLKTHLALIHDGGFNVWPLAKIVDTLIAGEPFPPKTIGISVDDAYLSLYQTGWPMFRDAGLPITVFASTEPLDRNLPDYMSWSQLQSMISEGVTVGNHTLQHRHMTDLDPKEVLEELNVSQRRFMDELEVIPELFAYPYGEYSLAVINAVKSAGFRAAFGQHSGTSHSALPIYELPRFALNERYGDVARFSSIVLNSLPLVVLNVTPEDTLITTNPPRYRLTIGAEMGRISGLACYASSEDGAAELLLLGDRQVEVSFVNPLPRGRSRVNCTMPGPDGQWRWYGRQFYTP